MTSTWFGTNVLPPTYQTDTVRHPPLAHIPAAGISTKLEGATIQDCLQFENRPPTPDKERKYRPPTLREPGTICRHFGLADVAIPEGPHGTRKARPEERLADTIKSYPQSELQQWKREHDEQVYASSRREPLGRGYVRGHQLPDGLGTTTAFGKPVHARELEAARQAGQVVNPEPGSPLGDSGQDAAHPAHALYVRSHGAYAPGEQRRRGYDWQAAGVDLQRHAFGVATKGEEADLVKKALQAGGAPQTVLQDARLAEWGLTARDPLGRPRHLGAGNLGLPASHTYGTPSVRRGREGEQCSVDRLMAGDYTPEQLAPDADLGRSLREGWRNLAPPGKVFGLPTVRRDIRAPAQRSVASTQNYGDEACTAALVSPCATAEQGITEEHYQQLRSCAEVRELVTDSGIQLEDAEFERVWAAGQQLAGVPPGDERCSVADFLRARHRLLELDAGLP